MASITSLSLGGSVTRDIRKKPIYVYNLKRARSYTTIISHHHQQQAIKLFKKKYMYRPTFNYNNIPIQSTSKAKL